MREKILTGVDGIDKMLYGGIPQGNQVVLAGGPGSGKTLFCFEYLYKGAKNGENGVLFSLEERPDMVISNAKTAFSDFKDIDQLIAENKLVVYGSGDIRSYLKGEEQEPRYAFGEIITEMETEIKSLGAKRVVIDSLAIIKLLIKDAFEYRNISMDLLAVLKKLDVTSILTVEMEAPEKGRMIFQPEFFIYDGILSMYSDSTDTANRTMTLEITKMRGTNHSFMTVPYEITTAGINLLLLAERKGD